MAKTDGLLQKLVEDKTLEVDTILLTVFHPGGKLCLEEMNFIHNSTKKLVDVLVEYDIKQWHPSLSSIEDKIFRTMSMIVTVLSDVDTLTQTKHLNILLPLDSSHSMLSMGQDVALPLKILTSLSSDLDTWTLLKVDYNIDTILMDMAEASKGEDGADIVDEGLQYVKYLSIYFQAIRGPNERDLPRLGQPYVRRKTPRARKDTNMVEMTRFL